MRPIPPALLEVQFALCVLTALLYATSGNSARRRHLAVGLNAFAFGGLLVATAHGVVAHEGFCTSCLLAWTGLGLALLLQGGTVPIVRWWLPAVLAGSLALRATTRGSSESALLVQERLKSGLTAAGFDYHVPRTKLRAGDEIPGLGDRSGLVLFLTQCSPCTRKALEQALRARAVPSAALTFVAADASTEWQVPGGYESARRIVDARAWRAAGIVPFGPPCLVRLQAGRVREVLL